LTQELDQFSDQGFEGAGGGGHRTRPSGDVLLDDGIRDRKPTSRIARWTPSIAILTRLAAEPWIGAFGAHPLGHRATLPVSLVRPNG